ncbi:hypothetical protein TMUPMC115_2531 [Tetragenococcus muriaticus PMC-11-5]|uniref:Uncharacterized protein n=1 Tax=Tetragenococcus muriaticus PMC-11-5 TaxID=1302649 RepID=A0A091BXX1_9ENTE|nr:hypothetical protein TMUPMC115_2531 [Tetragenococcus muriaticus PMC-11-5]
MANQSEEFASTQENTQVSGELTFNDKVVQKTHWNCNGKN